MFGAADRRIGPLSVRAVRDGLGLAGLLFAAFLFGVAAPMYQTVGFDAVAYWQVNLEHPYQSVAGQLGAFPYTPVAARAFAPAGLLSWMAFWWIWEAILVATVVWLGGRRFLLVLAFPPVAVELYHGNVHLLIAAAVALGLRYPAAWALVLLTKATPGIGLVWFLVRREWRQLGIALGVTLALMAASLAFDSRLWVEWINEAIVPAAGKPIGQPAIPIPLAIRLPLALVIVAWGARTNRTWTLPVAVTLALPILWFAGLSVLAAIPALHRPELRPDLQPERQDPRAAVEPGAGTAGTAGTSGTTGTVG
jgi:hypothetical protein